MISPVVIGQLRCVQVPIQSQQRSLLQSHDLLHIYSEARQGAHSRPTRLHRPRAAPARHRHRTFLSCKASQAIGNLLTLATNCTEDSLRCTGMRSAIRMTLRAYHSMPLCLLKDTRTAFSCMGHRDRRKPQLMTSRQFVMNCLVPFVGSHYLPGLGGVVITSSTRPYFLASSAGIQ